MSCTLRINLRQIAVRIAIQRHIMPLPSAESMMLLEAAVAIAASVVPFYLGTASEVTLDMHRCGDGEGAHG